MKKLILLSCLLLIAGFGCSNGSETNERIVKDKVVNKEIKKNPELCETINEDGTLPIADTYSHLPALGQLFTASHCDNERIEKLPAVENGVYTHGATVWLPTVADEELTQTFKDLQFMCNGDNEFTCKKWRLTEEASVEDMLKLRPFAPQMATDECINC